jgi:hypothetical protein
MQAPPVHSNSGTLTNIPCFYLPNSSVQNDLTAASQPGSAADHEWDSALPFYNQLNTSYVVAPAINSMPPPPTESNSGNLVNPLPNFFTAQFSAPQQ